jgi:hypothetical protein
MNKFLSKTFLLVLSFTLLFSPNLSFKVEAAIPPACNFNVTEEESQGLLLGYDEDVKLSTPCHRGMDELSRDFSDINVLHTGVVNQTYDFNDNTWKDSNVSASDNDEVYNKSETWRSESCHTVVRNNGALHDYARNNSIKLCEMLYNQRKKSADKKLYVAAGTFKFSTDLYSTEDVNNILNNNKDTYFLKNGIAGRSAGDRYSFIDRGDGYRTNYKPYWLIYTYTIFTYCSTTACEGWKFFDTNTGEVLEYETNQDKVWSFYPSIS